VTEVHIVHSDLVKIAERAVSPLTSDTRMLLLDQGQVASLYSLRAEFTKKRDHSSAATAGLHILKREARAYADRPNLRTHAKVILGLVSVIRSTASALGFGGATARTMASRLLEQVPSVPQWAARYIQGAPPRENFHDLKRLTGLAPPAWEEVLERLHTQTRILAVPAGKLVADSVSARVDLDVARNLSKIAFSEEQEDIGALPVYDRSESDMRLISVTVAGFRGSAAEISMTLTKNSKPVDLLLWGDNGVGKSTLIDGIEFALQGRIDRSADFNSSLRAKVRNLSVEQARAAVTLSDGSVESRSLVRSEEGRDHASREPVRPGFRLAPVAIRRADILRFLDTEALARGTIFFDYFPDPAGELGARPDEELNMLREEQFSLRVARDELSNEMRAKYPHASCDFSNKKHLDEFVKELLQEIDSDGVVDPIDALPESVRDLISGLHRTQARLAQIKKKLAAGVQSLNPRAYNDQQARIVPVLQAISEDLTNSFARITRADHVKTIKVLVGKSGPVSLDVVIEFTNGSAALPQQTFSEGYRDLIALLFFLAVTKRAGDLGQARVLVLDDALQSVDASVRLDVMDFVLENFSDWQLIITGHDRSWLNQLRRLYQAHQRSFNERMITRWTFDRGIELSDADGSIADDVREGIRRGRARATASATGLLLEQICQELSWRFEISIHRKEGDRYTLGDLWQGVESRLRKTSIAEAVKTVHMRLTIRNLLGAHYNDWAEEIPWSEVEQLASAALEIYDSTCCSGCGDWVRKSGACRCGNLTLNQ